MGNAQSLAHRLAVNMLGDFQFRETNSGSLGPHILLLRFSGLKLTFFSKILHR